MSKDNRIHMTKVDGIFVPSDNLAKERADKIKQGETISVSYSKPRNYKFHKKFFAMLGVGYEAFEPPEQYFRGMRVQKNFDRFRKDCICAAGHYEVVANLKGEFRAEARSISFGELDEMDFEVLYNKVVNVLLERVLVNYTRSDLDDVVDQLMRF